MCPESWQKHILSVEQYSETSMKILFLTLRDSSRDLICIAIQPRVPKVLKIPLKKTHADRCSSKNHQKMWRIMLRAPRFCEDLSTSLCSSLSLPEEIGKEKKM